MQQHGGRQHFRIAAFAGVNTHRIGKHPADMADIMGTVVAGDRVWNQRFGKRLKRLENSGKVMCVHDRVLSQTYSAATAIFCRRWRQSPVRSFREGSSMTV